MTDLDQAELRALVFDATWHCDMNGRTYVAVPLELLDRVTREFDVVHVRDARCGRYRQ